MDLLEFCKKGFWSFLSAFESVESSCDSEPHGAAQVAMATWADEVGEVGEVEMKMTSILQKWD